MMRFFTKGYYILSNSTTVGIREIRSQLLSWMLVVLNVLAIPTIAIGAIEAIQLGLKFTALFYILFSIPMLVALIFQKRMPYIIVVLLFLISGFSIGVYNLIDYGFSGAGIPVFFAVAVLATVFLGIRAGVAALIINAVAMVIVGYLMINSKMAIEINLNEISRNPVSWLAAIVVMLFLGFVIIFGYGIIQENLLHSLNIVRKQTVDLQEVNEKLNKDILRRKEVEAKLEKAKDRAEESDRLKSAFLANMSHEIRTPMNGILGFSELLKEPQLEGAKQLKYIEIIENSGVRMLKIINDIIDISKIESGQMNTFISEVNVNEVLDYIYSFFKIEIEKKGLQFVKNNTVIDQEIILSTDREKVIAILTNLVKNALKFTNKGCINMGLTMQKDFLQFFVKDTGLGIHGKNKEIIFDRFRQGNENLNKSHEGSGLGLAISKAYVEMLGGNIWVESVPQEKGSTFYFTLPLVKK